MLIRFIMVMAINLPGRAQRNEGRRCSGRALAPGRLTARHDPLALSLDHASEGPVFRRTSKTDDQPASLDPKGPGAKGRPTPSRKEAEAAARERAKAGMDKKAAQKLLRERRAESNAKVRQGMRSGDERYLPKRDQGPVKRFIRDYVDTRLSIAEFLLPLLVGIMALQYSGNDRLLKFGSVLMSTTILVVALDTTWMLFRLKRALRAEFPEENLRGTAFYTILRMLQLRWLRMPKPQVKIGGAPR
jgi:hypothetical protein